MILSSHPRTMFLTAAATILLTSPAFAGLTIIGQQVGGDVVFSGSGTVDLSTWMFINTVSQPSGLHPQDALVLGPNPQTIDLYFAPMNFSGPTSIGPGVTPFMADFGSGDPIGFSWTPGLEGMFVPAGYVSGDPIVGSEATFTGKTFASLGITEGIYTWTWDIAGGGTDFITVNIIPAPGALAVFGIAAIMTRRRRQK